MSHGLRLLTCCVVLTILPLIGRSQDSRPTLPIDAARQVARETLDRGIPGLSVAVAIDGRTVWAEGFGFADLEQKTPVTPETRFRIGSVSKPLTTAALARLVEEGRIDLEGAVATYVPSFPDKGKPITIRQLAGHLSGIRHYRGRETLRNKLYPNVLSSLEIFANEPLEVSPGEKMVYTTYGYTLLAAAMEKAGGEDFLKLVDRFVTTPLDMKHTVADVTKAIVPHRTRFYVKSKDAGFENAPEVDSSYKWAGGGYVSTPEDLVRFGSAFLDAGFLREETLKMVLTSMTTNDGTKTGYGLGWNVGKGENEGRRIGHTGGSVGGTTRLLIDRTKRVVVAVTANLSDAPLGDIDRKLIDLVQR